MILMTKDQKLKTIFNWSTGKDSALALYHLLKDERYDVTKLLTSVNAHYDRVSMHGLRRSLLEAQVAALNIPSVTLELPEQPDMETYETLMLQTLNPLIEEGCTHSAFGDIFLEDLKNYREEQLKKVGLNALFPIWKRDTKALIQEFVSLGFKAIVVCIKADLLDESFVGRELNEDFVRDLPPNVDPCGENGEFHTFCYDGPIFNSAIPFRVSEKTYREYKAPKQDNASHQGFWFVDLLP